MSIDIIIPNFNGAHLLEKNLSKVLLAHKNYIGKIIVVDDGSNIFDKQKLVDLLDQIDSKKIKLVEHQNNKGFSSAINTGVKNSSSEYVVLLNSDVVPSSDFLRPLVERMVQDENIFGIGCCDKSFENGKFVKRGRGIGTWRRGMVQHARGEVNQTDTFWISGGSCILRRQMFNYIGGMDPLYNPFYWEDIDLSYRARKAGFKIEFCSESIVEHYHNEGAIKQSFDKKKITSTSYRNQFIFVWKNINSPHLLFNHVVNIPLIIFNAIRSGDYSLLIGLFLALTKLPVIIKRRKKQGKLYKISDISLLHHIS